MTDQPIPFDPNYALNGDIAEPSPSSDDKCIGCKHRTAPGGSPHVFACPQDLKGHHICMAAHRPDGQGAIFKTRPSIQINDSGPIPCKDVKLDPGATAPADPFESRIIASLTIDSVFSNNKAPSPGFVIFNMDIASRPDGFSLLTRAHSTKGEAWYDFKWDLSRDVKDNLVNWFRGIGEWRILMEPDSPPVDPDAPDYVKVEGEPVEIPAHGDANIWLSSSPSGKLVHTEPYPVGDQVTDQNGETLKCTDEGTADPDLYADAKQWFADGLLQVRAFPGSDIWSDYEPFPGVTHPIWNLPPDEYRRNPNAQDVTERPASNLGDVIFDSDGISTAVIDSIAWKGDSVTFAIRRLSVGPQSDDADTRRREQVVEHIRSNGLEIGDCMRMMVRDDIKASLEKPPLGLRPASVVREARIFEVIEALERYREAVKIPPHAWVDELRNLIVDAEQDSQ